MNTNKLIKYLVMAAMLMLMVDSMPRKGIGDDTDIFLNPVSSAPPPSVMILMDESGSMYDLPCAVPDCQEDCGLAQLASPNNTNFFITMGYNPNTTYPVFDPCVNGSSCGNTNYSGQPGAFYPGDAYYEYGCQAWGDLGSISSACNTYTYNPANCINGITNYGYYYSSSNGVVFYSGNLLNFYPPKYVVLRKAIADVITYNAHSLLPQGKEVRIGLADFNSGTGAHILKALQPPCSQLGNANPQDYDFKGKFYNSLYGSSSSYSSDIPTSTPLADALLDVGSYFANNNTYFCQLINRCYTSTPNSCCPNGCSCSMGFLNPPGSQGSGSDSWCGTYNSNWQCEKMFTIVVTDGLANYDRYIENGPSSLRNFPPSNNICSSPGNDCECTSYQHENSWSGPYYTDPCFTDEIASFLHNNTIRSDAICPYTNGGPSIDTYTIGFYGSSISGSGANCSGTPIYHTSTNNCQLPFDVLQNAAMNGDGLFIPATNYQQIENAFVKALSNIVQKNHTYGTPSLPQLITSGASNTGTTTITGFKAYVASFVPRDKNFWYGDLREYTGTSSTTGTITLYDKTGAPFSGYSSTSTACSFSSTVPPPIWDAAEDLTISTLSVCNTVPAAEDPPCYLAPQVRNIYTVTPASSQLISATTNGATTWYSAANPDLPLGATQALTTSNALLLPIDFDVADTATMDNIIDYVRGLKADGKHVLGDIFHSDPLLVSPLTIPGVFDPFDYNEEYKTSLDEQGYLNATYNVPQIVIAGADDGMIHAFDAGNYIPGTATFNGLGNYQFGSAQFDYGTGQEVWAFVPYDLLPKLQYMQNPALVPTTTTGEYWTTAGIYTTISTSHVYYVDASAYVRNAYLPGIDNGLGLSGNAAYWHTVMIIGERLGGTYYICLDITNTLHPRFMWEFTTKDMGFTFAEAAPNAAPVGPVWLNYDPSTSASLPSPQPRWVVMLSGGWDPGVTSNRGRAFYVVDIATGKLVWKFDQTNDSAMTYPTPASVADIAQFNQGSAHGWWMESFLPDLGGQLWQFSYLPRGTAAGMGGTGFWAGDLDAGTDLVKTCIDPTTDKNCFWGERVFAAQNPPPVQSQAQQFYFIPSGSWDPCNNLWIGLGAGDRDDPLSCTPVNYLYDFVQVNPYTPLSSVLTASNLSPLSGTTGFDAANCGFQPNSPLIGWDIALTSFTGTGSGAKSISVAYQTGDVQYAGIFTPDPNACIGGTTLSFSCNALGGSGQLIAMAMQPIEGTNIKAGQLLYNIPTDSGIPSAPILVTSIHAGGGSQTTTTNTPPNPYTIPICGGGVGTGEGSTQLIVANSEGAVSNLKTIATYNHLMFPYAQLCIPQNVEEQLNSSQNQWSYHRALYH
ncbi:MAG: hypothetical protein M1491_09320 [Deltaproteobacteria bacterium]|nr:hypothetical protein [Deltaproteobacteria bacterium]MCL5276456.1 hypothetical protein [Deltaproteobacteria bacterium]